jgi:hypothetical protein
MTGTRIKFRTLIVIGITRIIYLSARWPSWFTAISFSHGIKLAS